MLSLLFLVVLAVLAFLLGSATISIRVLINRAVFARLFTKPCSVRSRLSQPASKSYETKVMPLKCARNEPRLAV